MAALHYAQNFHLRRPGGSGTQYFPEARSWPDMRAPLPKVPQCWVDNVHWKDREGAGREVRRERMEGRLKPNLTCALCLES
jgi:hypothetical protein